VRVSEEKTKSLVMASGFVQRKVKESRSHGEMADER